MRHGDKDGLKEIYDESGELILHPDEKVLVTEENVVPTIKTTWRYYGGDYLLEPSKGTIYLTNERFVFINTPERMFAIGGDESRAMSAPMESTFDLGDMSKGTVVREFFEIPNIEIMGTENKEGAVSTGEMVNIYILSSGNQFHLSMVLGEGSGLLQRLMNKKVETLDELVNNLKEFFRKTDWMFLGNEMEKYENLTSLEGVEFPGEEPDGSAPESEERPMDRVRDREPSTPSPLDKISYDRKAPLSPEVSTRSIEYFETLHRKGLIKEEIYQKLLLQFRIANPPSVPIPEAKAVNGEEVTSQTAPEQDLETETPPDVEGSVTPPEETEDSDDDLLNILNDTLTGMEGEAQENDVPPEPSEPPE